MQNKSKELEVAIKAAMEAGEILEKYFETEILKEFKEDTSIITLADKEAEEVIKKIIGEAFPLHSILGEETGMTQNGHEYVWYVDPLDATRNFSNGIPIFAVSIALAYHNELIIGVVYNPATRSLFYASKDKGAYLNDKKIFVSIDDRNRGIFTVSPGMGDDRKLAKEIVYYFPINVIRTVRDIGCSALELSYLARGGFEANIGAGRPVYDFAAGMIIAKEAGAKVTGFDGKEWKFPDNHFIASNGVFHDKLVAEVQKQKEKLGITEFD